MRRYPLKKLGLGKETVRNLNQSHLVQVRGAVTTNGDQLIYGAVYSIDVPCPSDDCSISCWVSCVPTCNATTCMPA